MDAPTIYKTRLRKILCLTIALWPAGSKFGALPPAVKNTVRAEAGAAQITDIETRYETGGPVYVIYFRNPELFAPMFVAADGSLLKPDLTLAVGAPRTCLLL